MATLIIYEESDEETVFETYQLLDTSILIGSALDNHLILDAPDIDSSHASLELRDGHWVMQDLGGSSGTIVNGEIIEGPFILYHGDLIELNHIKLKFQNPERGPTKEFPLDHSNEGNDDEPPIVKGRVWFVTIAGITTFLILIIVILLVVASLLGIISLGDLLPPWLVG